MKVVKSGGTDEDFIFFLNNQEINKLEGSPIEGNLWNREFPYNCLEEKLTLRLATDKDRTVAGGGGCNFPYRTEFYVKEFVYKRLKERGRSIGVRYDGAWNKIDLINYERERGWYEGLMESLGLIKGTRPNITRIY